MWWKNVNEVSNKIGWYLVFIMFKFWEQIHFLQLLSDLAASVGKSLTDLISANEKLWDALGKIKDHLKKEDVKACEDASEGNFLLQFFCNEQKNIYYCTSWNMKKKINFSGDPDYLNLLYLIAFLNGSRRNAKIERVSRLYTTMHVSWTITTSS